MSRRQSRPCRFGENCRANSCMFKHPQALSPFKDTQPSPIGLEEQKEADSTQRDFIAAAVHSICLSDLVEPIVYTHGVPHEPYEITGRADLGTFKTWDAAYDTLVATIYRSA